jgi:hypothetical protein
VQLLLELDITHLLEDVGVTRFVDLEGFVAVGVDDFVHRGVGVFLVGRANDELCKQSPFGGDHHRIAVQ